MLPAVIISLEQDATKSGNALAHSLLKEVKNYKCVATLYLMCDVPAACGVSAQLHFSVFHYLPICCTKVCMYVTSNNSSLSLLKTTAWAMLKQMDTHLQLTLTT